MTFVELLNDDYPDGVWIEKQYRSALNALAADEVRDVQITRTRMTDKGKPATRGIQYPDSLEFAARRQ
jgi:hypothetical protein